MNTVDDEVSKSSSHYSPLELGYLRKLIKLIMESKPTYFLSNTLALRACQSIPLNSGADQTGSMKPVVAEKAIHAFVKDGWLLMTR